MIILLIIIAIVAVVYTQFLQMISNTVFSSSVCMNDTFAIL